MKTKPKTKAAIIPQDSWSLYTFTFGPKYWAFNLLDYCITNEQFCIGTEKSLDGIYKLATGKDRNWNSAMMIHFTRQKPANYISTWEYIEPEPEDPRSAYYLCTATGERCWLCELWTNMWGGFPTTLYISIGFSE